jgi:FixJ family two-component response regulator
MPGRPLVSVVDDDESIRESLESLIRSVGFAAKVFASAEEFQNSKYPLETDCLILDVRMPGMNGPELQRQLAAGHHQIPIIFITAHGTAAGRSQALESGAVDYLIKPFSEEEVLSAVHTALSSK